MNINRRDEDNSETGVGCEPGLPSLPVFRVDYPFFSTSTRLLIFLPVFGIPISKQNCIFTDKYQRNS